MSKALHEKAPPGEAGSTDEQTRREFLAAQPPPLDPSFLDERAVLTRVPVSRRTWGELESEGPDSLH